MYDAVSALIGDAEHSVRSACSTLIAPVRLYCLSGMRNTPSMHMTATEAWLFLVCLLIGDAEHSVHARAEFLSLTRHRPLIHPRSLAAVGAAEQDVRQLAQPRFGEAEEPCDHRGAGRPARLVLRLEDERYGEGGGGHRRRRHVNSRAGSHVKLTAFAPVEATAGAATPTAGRTGFPGRGG